MDRISALDDKVLGRIVSLLPLKEMLRTSVLSRRWRRVWTAARAFDFTGAEVDCFDVDVYISRIDSYLDQLSASSSCTDIHFIFFPGIQDPQAADRWIRFATDHNVATLVFDLRIGRPVRLSFSSFQLCRSLTTLEICGYIMPRLAAYPLGPAFPSLRSLSLYDVTIADPRTFFAQCPVIERLTVEFPDDDRDHLLPASALRSCPLLSTISLTDCTVPREPPSAGPPAFPSLRAARLENVRVAAPQSLLDSCPVIAELTIQSPPEGFAFRLDRRHTVSTLRIIGRNFPRLSLPSLSPSLRTLALCDLKITNPPALIQAFQGLEVLLLKRVRIEPGADSGIQVRAPRMRHLMVQDSKGLGLVAVTDTPQLCRLFCWGDIRHLRVFRCAVPKLEEAFLHCMVKNPYGGKYYLWKNLMQPLSHVRLLSANWWFICEVLLAPICRVVKMVRVR
ncbi:F-box/LRR-repeat protein 13-like isoform X2 [Ananas comosus]|uniref:F-box/LRR-repeat protein 13-like isoform X2 n=1 Tax=Ananas comosus TaxID=4615 RepID=A0A6P5GSS9_ANACO|nr:F-box/LRR-repeat protein 13-like isoform X2 [Ananas comosus]